MLSVYVEGNFKQFKAVNYTEGLLDPAQNSIPELAPVMMTVLPFMLVELSQTPSVK